MNTYDDDGSISCHSSQKPEREIRYKVFSELYLLELLKINHTIVAVCHFVIIQGESGGKDQIPGVYCIRENKVKKLK